MSTRELTRPPRLHPGDVVAVVAPAGPVPTELLETGLALLRDWGLEVRVGKHVLDRHSRLDYLAGADADRATDLQRAWCDPEVKAVFCARGGYGCLRMIDHLDFGELATATPKILVGSSDVTALHEVFAAELGLATIFGPMIATKAFVHDDKARDHLRRTLFAPEGVTILTGRHAATMVPGRALGVTYGGNLSLLAGSLGAGLAARPPERGIALLEDVTEEPYRLDRFLIQLIRAGFFRGATGIALGSWTDCGPMDEVRAMLEDLLGDLGVPILWELGFGHCEAQRTVPLGVAAELDADAQRLSILQPALR
ncbi:S66 peptidase family protein [Saccharopolyspora flava]|uniref:Muramoyltetrapeptide carboxypeptidase n=1 Tax=Saccharopolyspora flava TaxID=95161 RepID=A0A1I6RYB2_9PSEU|nr:LD-carboxypeptidase [Saccharopolyspora flava]SFS69677.1 muramoyltetrapeptide carboxypeptidase [Saccharopolyspora flava]